MHWKLKENWLTYFFQTHFYQQIPELHSALGMKQKFIYFLILLLYFNHRTSMHFL